MGSSRFYGKPLEKLLDIAMIEHCYRRARDEQKINDAYVATCDEEIYDFCNQRNIKAIMTSSAHQRAVERVSEAVKLLEVAEKCRFDIVLMVQGDEPLFSPKLIVEIIDEFDDKSVSVVNLISKTLNKNLFFSKDNVKAVVDKNCNVMYFSREPIPSGLDLTKGSEALIQTGVIAFKRAALDEFISLPQSSLEHYESIDMNRFLESGCKVRGVITENIMFGVDTEAELKEAEKILLLDKYCDTYIKTGMSE